VPTYDYECKKCKKVREVMHSMKDSPAIVCEECGGKMERQIGAPTIVVKNSETAANAGWRN